MCDICGDPLSAQEWMVHFVDKKRCHYDCWQDRDDANTVMATLPASDVLTFGRDLKDVRRERRELRAENDKLRAERDKLRAECEKGVELCDEVLKLRQHSWPARTTRWRASAF